MIEDVVLEAYEVVSFEPELLGPGPLELDSCAVAALALAVLVPEACKAGASVAVEQGLALEHIAVEYAVAAERAAVELEQQMLIDKVGLVVAEIVAWRVAELPLVAGGHIPGKLVAALVLAE